MFVTPMIRYEAEQYVHYIMRTVMYTYSKLLVPQACTLHNAHIAICMYVCLFVAYLQVLKMIVLN